LLIQMHLHRFEIKSDFSGIHFHYIKGYVKNNLGMGKMHIHIYSGVSPIEDHSHIFSGITGPPVKTENGHIHKISGILQTANGHVHKYSGYTFEDVSYLPDEGFVSQRV
jgi:hypothetical protein